MLYMMDFWQFTYFMPGYSSASMRLWVTFMYFMSVFNMFMVHGWR